LLNSYLFIDK
jgi:hypothetical protein